MPKARPMLNPHQWVWVRRVLALIAFGICALAIFVGINCLPANRLRLFFGWHTLQVIEGAEAVTLCRVRYDTHGHRVISQSVLLSPEATRRVKSMVTNPKSYGWNYNYPCLSVDTGLIMQFHRGAEEVDAHFGFRCRMASLGEPSGYNWVAYDPMWNQVVSLMKQSFPKDSTVQSLPLHRAN